MLPAPSLPRPSSGALNLERAQAVEENGVLTLDRCWRVVSRKWWKLEGGVISG